MSDRLLIGIASIFLLGIGAQWLAWRLKLPSILLLLLFGFLAGPITGLLDPELLQGNELFPFVALAVGIILFEGGMSLRLAEYREVGKAVRNLITIGVLITWGLAAGAAYYLLGFSLGMSVIIGSILVVTGPTVIVPLLRHVRPTGRVGTVAKWEGITIDPIGAILAVLVLEFVLLLNEQAVGGAAEGGNLGTAAHHAIEGLFLEIAIGVGVSVIGAAVLILLLRRRLVPDYLRNPLTLMVVIGVFASSDVLQHESGLLATTLMGIIMANQPFVSVRRIVEFKEDLRVLLIGSLFIVLSARLELSALQYFVNPRYLLFLVVLMLLVRPAAVFFSTLGTGFTWKEKMFLAWLAPRGVVAAAVASLFSFRLQELYPVQADALVPLVFLVIVGTVAVYGLTISPLARWLGLAQPNPQGVLIIGAHAWAREMAYVLHQQGFRVMLLDSNPQQVRRAQQMGLEAKQVNVLAEGVMEEFDLSGIGRLLALTSNEEVNSLVALHFNEMFESAEVFQLATQGEQQAEELPRHLRGRRLFDRDTTYATLTERFDGGAEVQVIELEEGTGVKDLRKRYGHDVLPLFLIRGPQRLYIFNDEEKDPSPQPQDLLVALVGPGAAAKQEVRSLEADGAEQA